MRKKMRLPFTCSTFRVFMRIAFVLVPLLWAISVQADDTRTEFWPECDVFLKLNEKSRLCFFYSATKLDDRQTYSDGSVAGYFDFYALPLFRRRLRAQADAAKSKLFMIRAGYVFTRTPSDSPDPFGEHTPTLEVHGRWLFSLALLLTDRSRVDLRFVDGDYRPRYRNRLKLEHTFKAGWLELTPYSHAEAFYDWRYDKFHRFRYAVGAEMALGRHLVFESYYLRQRDTVSSPHHVNAIGAAMQLYFP
jgi:hypothetical protein